MNIKDLNQVKCTVDAAEVKRLKGLGCLRDKTTPDKFNIRVITRNGFVSSDLIKNVATAAETFGNGKTAMTTRLTMEIQSVPYDNIQPLMDFLGEHGIVTGGTGAKVRPVVSCKGTTCQYGLIDTYGLSLKIHERFFEGYSDVKLPHKFKIGVGGCPNNCIKPDLNDVGVIGQRLIQRDLSKCKGCKICMVEKNCPIKICKVNEGVLYVDKKSCNNCGRCLGKCPFHVTDEFLQGFALYIGGRWGKQTAKGNRISKLFLSEEEVLNTIEKIILVFKEKGVAGERFSDTINRIGFEKIEEEILSDDILSRKEEILAKEM